MGGQDNLSSSFWSLNNKVSKGDGPGQNVVPWQEVFYDSEVFCNHATPKTWYPHSPQEYHTAICGQHQVLGYFGASLTLGFRAPGGDGPGGNIVLWNFYLWAARGWQQNVPQDIHSALKQNCLKVSRSQCSLPGHVYQNISDIMPQYHSQMFCQNITQTFCQNIAQIFCQKILQTFCQEIFWRTHYRGWGSGWNHRPLGLAQAITPFNSNISRCLACLCVEIHCVVMKHDHVSHIALGDVFKYTNSRASDRNQTSFIRGETYPQELWAEPLGVEICWNGS